MSFHERHPLELLKTPGGYIRPDQVAWVANTAKSFVCFRLIGMEGAQSFECASPSEAVAWVESIANAQRASVLAGSADK